MGHAYNALDRTMLAEPNPARARSGLLMERNHSAGPVRLRVASAIRAKSQGGRGRIAALEATPATG